MDGALASVSKINRHKSRIARRAAHGEVGVWSIWERDGENAHVGSFRIGASADGRADAVSGADGVDVTAAPLGPDVPRGLFVAQDDENRAPIELQNFKYVSWADIEAALTEAGEAPR